jgi:hypothetical protein
MSERQADTYVVLCDEVSRIEAWANMAIEHAQGRQSSLKPVEALTGDRWFDMQGRLRVFGSRMARDEFDMMMAAAGRLQYLQITALEGQPGKTEDVLAVFQELHTHGARVRTIVSAEVGPLRDLLVKRWWQFRKRYHAGRILAAQEQYAAQHGSQTEEHHSSTASEEHQATAAEGVPST